jgi:drug/metabolite transporter (DMT)-like permease
MAVPRTLVVFLAVGLLAASQSGNIVRIGDAPASAIAAWRLLLAALLLAPLAGGRLAALRDLDRRDWILLGLAGAALAFHFLTWIAAVQRTTVANAATFFAVNPVITAVAGHLVFGERLGRRLLGAIAVGFVGVAVLGLADLRFSREHLPGDALAVLCSFLFTAYFLLGKRVREKLDNRAYVTALYGVAAAVCFVVLAATGGPVLQHSPRSWLCFLLMALVPTMVGHTALNYALRYLPAGRIATLSLAEPLLAGVVAVFAWGERLRVQTLVGYALICVSVVLVVLERGGVERAGDAPDCPPPPSKSD